MIILAVGVLPLSKKGDALCIVCNSIIKCAQHGIYAVKRHATNKSHISNCAKYRNKDGIIKKPTQQQITSCFNLNSMSHSDNVTSAETMFCVAMAYHNIPYAFANTATHIFPKMFMDSTVAKDFSCNRLKASYVISDGIGPFFKQELIDEIIKFKSFYCIQIDETPVSEKRTQQLDVLVRFFSEKQNKVVVHHLESHHLGRSTAENIATCVSSSLSCLSEEKLLCIFSDGPNVMKLFKKKMSSLHPDLLDLGECALHKVHNCFSKALSSFCSEIESLVIDLYYFFKNSALQSYKLRNLQNDLGLHEEVLIRHVSSRWLTLQSSLGRVIEQFPVLKEYFRSTNETVQSRCDSLRLQKIRQAFNDNSLLAKLLFLQNASMIFTSFLAKFQMEDPLIHILYDELVNLTKTIMGRFLKVSCFQDKAGDKLKSIDVENRENWLKHVEVGADTQLEMQSLTESEAKALLLGARLFYKTAAKYLIKVLPLQNKFLQHLKCLHPLMRTHESSVASVKYLASQLHQVIDSSFVSSLVDEWLRLQSENAIDLQPTEERSCNEDSDEEYAISSRLPSYIALDKYWSHILRLKDMSGNFKYKYIGMLVKPLLSLPHSNADSERGFSINKKMLESRSNLSLESINGIRHIKSRIKSHGNKVENLQINQALIKQVKSSRKRYQERLNTLNVNKQKMKCVKQSDEIMNELRNEELDLKRRLKVAQQMLGTAEKTISAGVKKKHMASIENGQTLLAEASNRISSILDMQEKNRKEMHKIKNNVKKQKAETKK